MDPPETHPDVIEHSHGEAEEPLLRPRVPPSMLSAANGVYAIINKRVRRPIDPDLRVGISIPESVLNAALDVAGLSAVFVALVCMRRYLERAENDEFKKELNESRAAYAESLAQELVHAAHDRGELFVWVLANKWPDPIDLLDPHLYVRKKPTRRTTEFRTDANGRSLREPTFTERLQRSDTIRRLTELFGMSSGGGYLPMFSPGEDGNQRLRRINTAGDAFLLPVSSAIEKAVEIRALHFLADVAVQDAIEEIWMGTLVLQPTQMLPSYTAVTDREIGFAGIANGRLRIPRYQYFTETAIFVVFLFNFTLVVNGRDKYPQIEEWLMWIQAIAYTMHEVYQVLQTGITFYFAALWNTVDALMYGIFMSSFAIRMYAINQTDESKLIYYNDVAYDLVSVNAVFLWTRILAIFSAYRYFGTSVLITKAMLKDSLLFLVLFALVLVGFAQTFIGLNPTLAPRTTVGFLLKAVLQAADYEAAESYHPVYGVPLFMIWLTIAGIILMNLLIAIFNTSYSTIVENADVEYEYNYAVRVLDYALQADDRPFFPPFNLFDVVLFPFRPFSFFKPLEGVVWTVITLPFALLIAIYETVFPPASPLSRNQAAALPIVSIQADDADEVETQDEDKDLGRRVIERLDRMEDRQDKFGDFVGQVDRVLVKLQETAQRLQDMADQRGKRIEELEGLLTRVLEKIEKK